MAVEILRPAPESAGARRASALEGAELVSPAACTKVPDPEVSDKAVRRRFTAKYKLSLLQGLMPARTQAALVNSYGKRDFISPTLPIVATSEAMAVWLAVRPLPLMPTDDSEVMPTGVPLQSRPMFRWNADRCSGGMPTA